MGFRIEKTGFLRNDNNVPDKRMTVTSCYNLFSNNCKNPQSFPSTPLSVQFISTSAPAKPPEMTFAIGSKLRKVPLTAGSHLDAASG